MNDNDPKAARANAKAEKARAKALRPWWKRKRLMIPLAVVALIVAVAVGSSGDEDDGGNDVAASESDTSPGDGRSEHYSIGDTSNTAGLDVTLHAVTDPYVPSNELGGASDGSRLVAADITLVNTEDEATTFSTIMGLELFDTDSRAWNITITADNLPTVDGDLQPGESRRGTAVFELPADAQLSHLIVKGSLTATGSRFDLG